MFTSVKALSKNCLFPPFSFLESECADTSRMYVRITRLLDLRFYGPRRSRGP